MCSRDFNRRDIWDFVCVAAISIAGIFGLYLRARVAATRSIAEIFGL